MRKALRLLVATGLVEQRPRRGAVVSRPDPRRLAEMFETMAELDAICAGLCARGMGRAARGLWQRLRGTVFALIVPLLLPGFWHWVVAAGMTMLIPSPAEVAAYMVDLAWDDAFSATLHIHLLASMSRVCGGFALAALVAVRLGILFGLGPRSAFFLVVLGAFHPILRNTAFGVRSVGKRLFEAAPMGGCSPSAQVFKVVLPAALPSIVTGLRPGLGFAWFAIVVGEMTDVPPGLGAVIMDGRTLSRTEFVICGMIVIGIAGVVSGRIVMMAMNRLLRWTPSHHGRTAEPRPARRRQDLCAQRPEDRGAARREAHGAQGRIRLPDRRLGLRQVDVAAHRAGLRAAFRRPCTDVGQALGRPGARPRHGVPGLRPVPVPDGAPEHRLPPIFPRPAEEGGARHRRALRGRLSAPALGWDAAARGHRPRARERRRDGADGRTLRRTRRHDARTAAGRAARDPAAHEADRAVRHAFHRGGDLPRRPGRGGDVPHRIDALEALCDALAAGSRIARLQGDAIAAWYLRSGDTA